MKIWLNRFEIWSYLKVSIVILFETTLQTLILIIQLFFISKLSKLKKYESLYLFVFESRNESFHIFEFNLYINTHWI